MVAYIFGAPLNLRSPSNKCIRGVVRQLGRPALLAAMYSGDGPGAAAAAMAEVGAVVASSVHELERGSAGTPGVPGALQILKLILRPTSTNISKHT